MMRDQAFKVSLHGETFSINVCHEWFCDMLYRGVDAVEEITEAFIVECHFEIPDARDNSKASIKEQITRGVVHYIEYLKHQNINRKGKLSWLKQLLNTF